jgi:hypothetical protein
MVFGFELRSGAAPEGWITPWFSEVHGGVGCGINFGRGHGGIGIQADVCLRKGPIKAAEIGFDDSTAGSARCSFVCSGLVVAKVMGISGNLKFDVGMVKVRLVDGYIVADDLMLSSVYDGHRFGEPFVSVWGVPNISYGSVTKKARAAKDLCRRKTAQRITALD